MRFAVLLVLLSLLIGCRRTAVEPSADPEDRARKTIPLRVLVVDSPTLARAIQREWSARAEGTIVVQEKTSEQLLAIEGGRLGADAVIYPSGFLGELAARDWLSPLDSSQLQDPVFNYRDLLPLLRLREIAWGEQLLAVPLGSPQLTLFYRRDLFAELGRTPPRTWEEYAETLQALASHAEREQPGWAATAEPLADGWAGQVLLARAAAYARHRSQFSTLFDSRTMEPLIAGPPFVRALEELVAAAKLGAADATALDPAAIRRGFAEGKYAMALSWPSGADRAAADSTAVIDSGFAELPGAQDAYSFRQSQWETRNDDEAPQVTLLAVSGRLGSVTRECRRPRVAFHFLFWVSGAEMGQHIAAESPDTTLYRESQLNSAARWIGPAHTAESAKEYAAAVLAAQSRSDWLASPRIPGRARYLAALDQAVQQAVRGEASPAEALTAASAEWQAITAELGVEQQQNAYLKSLGLEP